MRIKTYLFVVILIVTMVVAGCYSSEAVQNPLDSEYSDAVSSSNSDTGLDSHLCPAGYVALALESRDGSWTRANAINNAGQIAGETKGDQSYESDTILWKIDPQDPSHIEWELIELDSDWRAFRPLDLNEKGEMVGELSYMHDYGQHLSEKRVAAYWSANTGFIFLDGEYTGKALGINNNGTMVGQRETLIDRDGEEMCVQDFYVWSSEFEMIFGLCTIEEADSLEAGGISLAINNHDVVCGHLNGPAHTKRGFRWTPADGFQALGGDESADVRVADLNDHNVVVGGTLIEGDSIHPVMWDTDGELIDLGILPYPEELSFGESVAINNNGLIVGTDRGSGFKDQWLWCEGAKRNLADMVVNASLRLDSVHDINDSNWILGQEMNTGGFLAPVITTAYVLIPLEQYVEAQE